MTSEECDTPQEILVVGTAAERRRRIIRLRLEYDGDDKNCAAVLRVAETLETLTFCF